MRTVLKASFGLLLLALLLWRLDLYAIGTALGRYSWPWLLAALGLVASSWPLAAARWKLFVPESSYSRLLELTLIGQFYAVVLPGQLAGELVKAYRLAKGTVDAERLAASVVVDRIIGTIALLVVGSCGLLLSQHHLPSTLAWLFTGLTLALIISLYALRLQPIHRLATHLVTSLEGTRLRGLATSLHRAIHAWCDFGRSPARLLASWILGVLFQLLGVAIVVVLANNLGIDLPLADWAWIFGLVSLAVLLPVTLGGIGLREGALVGCLGFLGVSAEQAIALSLGILAVTVSAALVGGGLELAEVVRRRTSLTSR